MTTLLEDISWYGSWGREEVAQCPEISAPGHQEASGMHPKFKLEIVEWFHDTDRFPPNIKPTELVYQSEPPWKSPTDQLRDLDSSSRAAPCLRIIFAPLDYPNPSTISEFRKLFAYLQIPTGFLSERAQSVAHSFGATSKNGRPCDIWFHYLCRSPWIDSYHRHWEVSGATRDSHTGNERQPGLWDRLGVYMKVDYSESPKDGHMEGNSPTASPRPFTLSKSEGPSAAPGTSPSLHTPTEPQRRLTDSPRGDMSHPSRSMTAFTWPLPTEATAYPPEARCITLVCFGVEENGSNGDVWTRLNTLTQRQEWRDMLLDPYILLDIIVDELYLQASHHIIQLRNVFRDMENSIIQSTNKPKVALRRANFTLLHNISKDAIYLEEGINALILTIRGALRWHQKHMAGAASEAISATQASLEYRRTVAESCRLQIISLKDRTQNLIQLTFNLRSQRDSQVLFTESNSMHVIAVLGLVLVPIGSLSAFVQTPFFKLDEDKKIELQIGTWAFLALSISMTVAVMIGWVAFRQWAKPRR